MESLRREAHDELQITLRRRHRHSCDADRRYSITPKGKGIGIEITTAPPASMEVNQTASIAATVTKNHSNMGVDWSCTPGGACGTFNPAHTASGAATVYTAPRRPAP